MLIKYQVRTYFGRREHLMSLKKLIIIFSFLLIICMAAAPEFAAALETYTYVSTLRAFPNNFSSVYGVAIDSSGNIYVIDSTADKVLKFSSNFISQPITFSTTFSFDHNPGGIAVDNAGNIYISDDNSVRKFSPTGALQKTYGTWTGTSPNIPGPITIDLQSNDLYIVATQQDKIYKFSSNGALSASWGISGSGNGQFHGPRGIALYNDLVYVVDSSNARVQFFTKTGTYTGQWSIDISAYSIAFNSDGNCYVTYPNLLNVVKKYDTSGAVIDTLGGETIFSPFIPLALATDNADNVYVTSIIRIIKFNPDGTPIAIYNGPTNFQSSYCVAVDSAGNMLIAEGYPNNRILKFTSTYVQIPIIFDGTFSFFNTPGSIALDRLGNIYISDSTAVRVFSPTGTLIATIHAATHGDIAVDSALNVYLTDPFQNLIYKFTPNGEGGYTSTSWTGTLDHPISAPSGIAVYGNLVYVTQNSANQILVLDANGGYYVRSWTTPTISSSDSIAADSAGNIYVCYPLGNSVEKFTNSGTLLATISPPGTGDGQVINPHCVAVNSAGYVYVADGGRIQKFSTQSPSTMHFEFSTILSPQTATKIFLETITAKDSSGNTQTSFTGPVALTCSNGATITPSVITLSGGSWTGFINVGSPGIGVTLTATGDAGAQGTSNSFDVVSNTYQFVFNTIPTPQIVGRPISTSIQVQDFSLHNINTYSGTITLACSNGAIISSSTLSIVNGYWEGHLTIASPGYHIYVIATASDGTYGTSLNFNVIPALESTDVLGVELNSYSPVDTVYASGSGYSGSSVNVYVVLHQSSWTTGDVLTDVRGAPTSVSLTDGAFNHVVLWVNPEPGLYDIIADTNSNGHYDVSINALDSKDSLDVTPGGTSGFFVVPEYAFGGLASLAACFIGFVIFKKRSQLHL